MHQARLNDRAAILRKIAAPYYLAALAAPADRLTVEASILDQPGTALPTQCATKAADEAVNAVMSSLHFNAGLAPVLGHAAGRALVSRRR